MSTNNRISELASIISDRTAEINSYFISNKLPTPSFDMEFPPGLMTDPKISVVRGSVLEAIDELHLLMVGPMETLFRPASMPSVKPIERFKLASVFEKEATFGEIASASGLTESQVKRLLRHAMTFRIFEEPTKGVVAHTAASKVLAKNHLVSQAVGMMSDEMWPAETRLAESISKWGDSGEPTHCAFNIAENTNSVFFEELAKLPERTKRFADTMTWLSNRPEFQISHTINGYNWGDLGSGAFVDIGGSYGHICIDLAGKFPALNFVVQDRLKVVVEGKTKLPAHLQSQVSFMEHDMFEVQPVKGARVYLLRQILHDWSDLYAIRILKALVPALGKDSKVLINEKILPEPGTVSAYKERPARDFDLGLWETSNGKERDLEDWIQLLKDSDPRFKLLDIRSPTGSSLSIMEIGWVL